MPMMEVIVRGGDETVSLLVNKAPGVETASGRLQAHEDALFKPDKPQGGYVMKATKRLMVLLVAVAIVATAQLAFARGSETTGGSFFDSYIDCTAQGNKYFATLAILYTKVCDPIAHPKKCNYCPAGDYPMTMEFGLRIGDGRDFFVYSGASTTKVCFLTGLTEQANVTLDFMNSTVLPALGATSFALRSVDRGAEGRSPLFFTIMDLVLAVEFPPPPPPF
jgi:hypothetical protein